ncbi:aminomethyltransferase [Cyclonatronum proteinivorum]|uniref:Aminomethyltransferase n=1 Tax=Cyclonatronum proteinivorum TaxID=1457365 RepID=A0A345UJE0_9BACT|nr:glycine cleavage system aminomethyltransferase GcvT [Cyclonatronum proteinivorum]AXJ00592.1 aminomethyltransferase [Cyclonatronum proteinivorum]
MSDPQKTPFYDIHEQAGAKLIDFGGFMMPVQYSGIKKEHEAVRSSCGMFDVSHMGEIFFTGPNALAAVQHITVNDASKLVPGKAQYSAMCYENGGIVDDLLVYMLDTDRYMLVVNASNKDKDLAWMLANNPHGAEIADASDDTCLLAVQGPKSVEALQSLTDVDLSAIKFYTFTQGRFAGFEDIILSATGYTGEKGFEIYFDRKKADPAQVWHAILKSAEAAGVELLPAGLGARDTLRLEMGYALYGNDITQDTHPLEAGLGWITKFAKGDFVGKAALLDAKEAGISRRLVGFITENKRDIPRNGYRILDAEGAEIGFVTSGTQSVTEVKGIGMGYVKTDFAANDTPIFIEIRGKAVPATVSKSPFVKKA